MASDSPRTALAALVARWRADMVILTQQDQHGFSGLAAAESEWETLERCADDLAALLVPRAEEGELRAALDAYDHPVVAADGSTVDVTARVLDAVRALLARPETKSEP